MCESGAPQVGMSKQIVKIENLRKYYGAKLILDDVQLSLNRGERAALVGENGVGKTTLARLILGQETPDHGSVAVGDGAIVGYLPQEVQVSPRMSVQQYIESVLGELQLLRQQLALLESELESAADLAEALREYGRVQERFERRGGYTLDERLGRIFAGLEITHIEPSREMMSLSGGEKTRVGLAALLLQEPDLLILDEPTNHLDRRGLTWLEDYLLAYPNALLMITHDRQFINRVATKILDLSAVTRSLATYHGSYEDYLALRNAQYDQEVEAYHAQVNQMKALRSQIKRETHGHRRAQKPTDGDKYIRWHGGQTAERSAGKLARSARQELEALQANKLDNPRHVWQIKFDFCPHPLTSMEPLQLRDVSFGFGDETLFAGVSATLNKGDRIALVAPNGGGKTTLLRLITGELKAAVGEVAVMSGARLGYLDQTGESFDDGQNVLQALREIAGESDDNLLTLLHRSGLFRDAHLAGKTIGQLSLGQRRKLGLACLIHQRANVLLLDEPTNHLDLLSLEALEEALIAFPGAMLAATHDRYFIEKVATGVWYLRDGRLELEPRD